MGKCIDYTWMGGGDRAVSVEAGVLMQRTPSVAAAEVGDPDAEDIGSRNIGLRFTVRRTSAATTESRGPRERCCGGGGEGRAAAATSEGEAGRPPPRARARSRETAGRRRRLGAASSACFFLFCVQ